MDCLPSDRAKLLLKAALAVPPGAVHWWLHYRQERPIEGSHRWLLGPVYQQLAREQYRGPDLESLRQVHLSIWGRHTQLAKAARQALDHWQEAGIRAALLKGMAFHCWLPSQAPRSMADIDMLIAFNDLDAASDLLEQQGWVADGPRPSVALRKIQHGRSWRKSGLSLDLHWQLMPECLDPGLDAKVMSRAQSVSLRGRPALTPDPTDLLMHTLVHGCKCGSSDGWVLDAGLLLQNFPVDWARFLDQTQARRITLQCRLGLEFLAREMHAPVPESVLLSLKQSPVSWVDRLYCKVKGQKRELGSILLWPILEYLRLPAGQRPAGFLAYLRLRWQVEGSLLAEAYRRLRAYLRSLPKG